MFGSHGDFGSFMGPVVIIIAGFIILMFFIAISRQRSWRVSGPTLVLRKFQINKLAASISSDVINIIGRPSGLIAWLLTLIGLETESSLRVTGKDIFFKDASLFGQQNSVVAINSISSIHCGYRKPIGYLMLSVIFPLAGLWLWLSGGGFGIFFGGLFLGVIFFVGYFLLKKILILIITRAGTPIGLVFKRSVIENVAVDIEQARLAINIINNMIVSSQKSDVDIKTVFADAAKAIEPDRSEQPFCIHCGQPLEKNAKFCTSCGHGI